MQPLPLITPQEGGYRNSPMRMSPGMQRRTQVVSQAIRREHRGDVKLQSRLTDSPNAGQIQQQFGRWTYQALYMLILILSLTVIFINVKHFMEHGFDYGGNISEDDMNFTNKKRVEALTRLSYTGLSLFMLFAAAPLGAWSPPHNLGGMINRASLWLLVHSVIVSPLNVWIYKDNVLDYHCAINMIMTAVGLSSVVVPTINRLV